MGSPCLAAGIGSVGVGAKMVLWWEERGVEGSMCSLQEKIEAKEINVFYLASIYSRQKFPLAAS